MHTLAKTNKQTKKKNQGTQWFTADITSLIPLRCFCVLKESTGDNGSSQNFRSCIETNEITAVNTGVTFLKMYREKKHPSSSKRAKIVLNRTEMP